MLPSGVDFTNVFWAHFLWCFSYEHLFSSYIFLCTEKTRVIDVGEIDPWCQFHQRFFCKHFLYKHRFGSFYLVMFSLAPKVCTKNLRKKRWWNWLLKVTTSISCHFEIFWLEHANITDLAFSKSILYMKYCLKLF